jgi:soluble lytic murein transglycosylase-like protein
MRVPALLATFALLAAACSPPVDEAAQPDPTEVAEVRSEVEAEPSAVPEPPPEPEPVPEPTPEPVDPVAELLALPEPTPETGPPAVAEDPDGLALQLVAAERAIRDPNIAPADLAAAGHLQQVAYRTLGRHPEWAEHVIAVAPEELRETIRRNTAAGAALYAMHTPSDPDEPVTLRELPSWQIIAPPPPEELLGYYREAEAASGVHWSYLAAINLIETRMGRIRGDSHAGAQGPMQFMPGTWGDWGEGDVHNPRDAILAAGRYLRWGGMPDDVDGAIFRYNRDVRYVEAVRTYAEEMQADERAYYGYYHWQVYFSTGVENVWLAVGYDGRAS